MDEEGSDEGSYSTTRTFTVSKLRQHSAVMLDTSGDGKVDSVGWDTTGDGMVDTIKQLAEVTTEVLALDP